MKLTLSVCAARTMHLTCGWAAITVDPSVNEVWLLGLNMRLWQNRPGDDPGANMMAEPPLTTFKLQRRAP